MTRPVRIALAGAGTAGRVHLDRIAESDACCLAALVDPAPDAHGLAARAGVALYRELGEMLGAERPDGVILATPNTLHVAGAIECLQHGIPVLIEKPVAGTLTDAEVLIDAQQRAGVPVLVGHHRRHSAILDAAREAIGEGRLGRLVAISGSAVFCKPDAYFDEAPWRRRQGAGPVLLNMIHEVDTLRALVGAVAGEIVEVQAMVTSATRGFEVEDSAVVGLRFAAGALASLVLSDCATGPHSWEQTSGENRRYDHHADDDCYHIAGTCGSLCVPTMRLRHYEGEASWWLPLVTERLPVLERNPLSAQLAHFCEVIQRRAAPLVSAQDATRTLEVTLAITESARGGRPVAIHSAANPSA